MGPGKCLIAQKVLIILRGAAHLGLLDGVAARLHAIDATLTGRVARRLDCTPDWLRALLKRLEALLPPRARAQLDKARNPPPRRAQRSIWDGGFAVKKKTANGGVRRLGNGRSGAAPAAVARAPAPRRTFTETGDDLAFFLEAGRQREARAAARSPS